MRHINITMSQNEPNKPSRGKGWFCTWPHCPIPKEAALKILDSRLMIKEYVICEENHKDGSPHLHAFIKLRNRTRFSSTLFDLEEYHGNYQPARSFRAVLIYVTKGNKYISNIDIKSALAKKGKLTKEDLLKDVDYVLDNEKITPLQVANWYKNSCVYKMLINGKKEMPEVMPEKRRHLWIWGSSNTGKTTLLRRQMKEKGYENFFQIPSNNDWIGYDDQYYLYFDEFKGQLTIQELNKICDGGAKMNVKGGSVMLRYDVQVIILSNFSIEECYNRAPQILIDALNNRFISEHSDEMVNLNN